MFKVGFEKIAISSKKYLDALDSRILNIKSLPVVKSAPAAHSNELSGAENIRDLTINKFLRTHHEKANDLKDTRVHTKPWHKLKETLSRFPYQKTVKKSKLNRSNNYYLNSLSDQGLKVKK